MAQTNSFLKVKTINEFKFCLFHKLNFGGTMVRGCGGAEVRESSK